MPELGEDNVLQTTFSDFASAYIRDFKEIESFTQFIERYYKSDSISEEEYTGYTNLYDELNNLISEFNIGETSPNAFLRNLYDLTKMYEHLGDSIYTNSMYDLLADTYIELVTINLRRKTE